MNPVAEKCLAAAKRLALLGCALVAFGVNGQPLYSADIHDGHAMGVIATAAGITGTNVIVIGDVSKRFGAELKSLPKDRFLVELARAAGLVHSVVEGIHVFSPSACNLATVELPPGLNSGKVTMHSVATTPHLLVGVLAVNELFKSDLRHIEPPPPSHLIWVRVESVLFTNLVSVLGQVSGVQIVAGPDGHRLTPALATACGSAPTSADAMEQLRQKNGLSLLFAVCSDKSRDADGILPPRCRPLDKVGVEMLRPRGWIQQQGEKRIALVELPDGVTHPVRVNDFIGPDMAGVMGIDDLGIRLLQLDYKDEEVLAERWFRLTWGGDVEPIKSRRPQASPAK